MAPFVVAWALVWVILSFPGYPPGGPRAMVQFIVAAIFLVYCIIVLLVDFGLARI